MSRPNTRCWCAVCDKKYSYALEPDELKALMGAMQNPLTEDGHLILACDACLPPEKTLATRAKKILLAALEPARNKPA